MAKLIGGGGVRRRRTSLELTAREIIVHEEAKLLLRVPQEGINIEDVTEKVKNLLDTV